MLAETESRFDLNIPEFRAHLRKITGLDFDSGPDAQLGIDWWNTAGEEDARNMRSRTAEDAGRGVSLFENTGCPMDLSRVWKIQTRKIQLVWDAWRSGRPILLGQIQNILQREFRL